MKNRPAILLSMRRLCWSLLLCTVWLSLPFSCFGQEQVQNDNRREAEVFLRKAQQNLADEDYGEAFSNFRFALIIAPESIYKEISAAVDAAKEDLDNHLEVLRDEIARLEREVEVQRRRAEKAEAEVRQLTAELEEAKKQIQELETALEAMTREMQLRYRRSEARRLAALADRERERQQANNALQLAFLSKLLATDMEAPAAIDRAFGQAVLATYGTRMSSAGSGLTDGQFSPDSRQLLLVSRDHNAYLWDSTGRSGDTLRGHRDFILSAAFSADSRHVLTSARDSTARLWNLEAGKVDTLMVHRDVVEGAVFSPVNRDEFLTYSRDGTARLWRREAETLKSRPLAEHRAHILEAGYSPDGKYAFTRGADSLVVVWEVESGEKLRRLPHEDYVYAAVFAPRVQDQLLTASADGIVRLWETKGEELLELPTDLQLATDGDFLAADKNVIVAAADHTALIWEWEGNSTADASPKILEDHQDVVKQVVVDPTGNHFLTLSRNNPALRLWNAEGKLIALMKEHRARIRTAVFSGEGDYFLTASDDGTAKLWDLQGNLLMSIPFEKAVTAAVFSPDGRYVLATSLDGTAVLCPLPQEILNSRKPCMPAFTTADKQTFGLADWPSFLHEWIDARCPTP